MAGEPLFIHTWSNGDISVYCYKPTCLDAPTHNYSNRSWSDHRAFSKTYSQLGFLDDQDKFIGCIHCKRGAEVTVIRKSIYALKFTSKCVEVWLSENYLGGNRKLIHNWQDMGIQELYRGNW